MTDLPGGEAAARAIRAAMGKRVRYTGAGVTSKSVIAVRSNAAAGLFMENNQNVRQLSFEIGKEDLTGEPDKGDIVIENDGAGAIWAVIEHVDRADVDAWVVRVKAAS
ncbi:hypothetical protein J3454_14375 [Erythrobacter sp. NFXS35]|uniref:hypothetical protein n=1 Tax=Erythrobacter sp. NFXS35 TaxID=2818436 RepID=UPI0032DEA826